MPTIGYTTLINNVSPHFDELLTLSVKGIGRNLIGMMLSKSILLFLILSGAHILFCAAQEGIENSGEGAGSGSDSDDEHPGYDNYNYHFQEYDIS